MGTSVRKIDLSAHSTVESSFSYGLLQVFLASGVAGFRSSECVILDCSALHASACSHSQIFPLWWQDGPRIFKFLSAHGLREAASAFPNMLVIQLYMGVTVLNVLCVFFQRNPPETGTLLHSALGDWMDHVNVFFALWFLYLADVDPWQDIEESEVRVFIPSASSLRCSHVLAVSLNCGLHLSTLPT